MDVQTTGKHNASGPGYRECRGIKMGSAHLQRRPIHQPKVQQITQLEDKYQG